MWITEAAPVQAVRALLAAGWSESRIARAVGTSQPTIHRIKNGHTKLEFGLGLRLIHLAGSLPAVNDDTGPAPACAEEGRCRS